MLTILNEIKFWEKTVFFIYGKRIYFTCHCAHVASALSRLALYLPTSTVISPASWLHQPQ